MSWNISLNGPKSVVRHELADAIIVLDQALDRVENADLEQVYVSVGGYVSWNDKGEIVSSSVNFSVQESQPPQPPKPVVTETEAAPVEPAY